MMPILVKVVVFLSSLALVKAFFSLWKKKSVITIDIDKQKKIEKLFDEKISQLKEKEHEKMDKEQVLAELNRYRDVN